MRHDPFPAAGYPSRCHCRHRRRGKDHSPADPGRGAGRTASGPAVHHHQDSPVFGPALRPDSGGAGRTAQGASAAVCRDRPTAANQTICVVGASGFGRPIAAAAHRPERYALLAGMPEAAEATPEAEARVLRSEDLHTKVYVNQVETLWNLADARALARLMDCPVLAGSLWRREYFPCW